MKRFSTFFLRCTVFVAGAVMLAICSGVTWLVITRSSGSSNYYFLHYVLISDLYLSSIPFLIALYQSYKILDCIDSNNAFSALSVKALKIITRCAVAVFIISTVIGLPFFYMLADIDDAPGIVFIGLALTGFAFVIAVFASVLNRLLQEAIEIKSENDLTI